MLTRSGSGNFVKRESNLAVFGQLVLVWYFVWGGSLLMVRRRRRDDI